MSGCHASVFGLSPFDVSQSTPSLPDGRGARSSRAVKGSTTPCSNLLTNRKREHDLLRYDPVLSIAQSTLATRASLKT